MIDVKNDSCNFNGCNKQHIYGLVEGKPIHCTQHKLPNMTNVKTKKCEESTL